MSTNKKFRVQNGLDVTGEVTVGGVTVINADGTVVSDVSDQLVPLQADVAALETAVENIIGTSPETLDTLQEIVAAYEGADSDLQLLIATAVSTGSDNADAIATLVAQVGEIPTTTTSTTGAPYTGSFSQGLPDNHAIQSVSSMSSWDATLDWLTYGVYSSAPYGFGSGKIKIFSDSHDNSWVPYMRYDPVSQRVYALFANAGPNGPSIEEIFAGIGSSQGSTGDFYHINNVTAVAPTSSGYFPQIIQSRLTYTQEQMDAGDFSFAWSEVNGPAATEGTFIKGAVGTSTSVAETIAQTLATLTSDVSALTGTDTSLTTSVSANAAAIAANTAAISAEATARQAAIDAIPAPDLSSYATSASVTAGDLALQDQIDAIVGTSPATLDTLQEIVAAFEGADSDLQALMTANSSAISTLDAFVGEGNTTPPNLLPAVNFTSSVGANVVNTGPNSVSISHTSGESAAINVIPASTFTLGVNYEVLIVVSNSVLNSSYAHVRIRRESDTQIGALYVGDDGPRTENFTYQSGMGDIRFDIHFGAPNQSMDIEFYLYEVGGAIVPLSTSAQTVAGAVNELHTEIQAMSGLDTSLTADIESNTQAIADEVARATAAEAALAADIAAESSARSAKGTSQDALIAANATAISNEETRATAAEQANTDAIVAEAAARASADSDLSASISAISSGVNTGDLTVTGSATFESGINVGSNGGSIGYDDTSEDIQMMSDVDMSGNLIHNLGTPVAATDAASKSYVDGRISDVIGGSVESLDTIKEVVDAFEGADSDLQALITANSTSVSANTTAIAAETTRAQGVEASLQSQITAAADTSDLDSDIQANATAIAVNASNHSVLDTFVRGPVGQAPSTFAQFNIASWNEGDGIVPMTNNGTYHTFSAPLPDSNGNQGQELVYASDAGKSSGKWYYFLNSLANTTTPGFLVENGGSQTANYDWSFHSMFGSKIVYVDLDNGTVIVDNMDGTQHKTTGSITVNAGDVWYPGVHLHRPSVGNNATTEMSFDSTYATPASIRTGYSLWTAESETLATTATQVVPAINELVAAVADTSSITAAFQAADSDVTAAFQAADASLQAQIDAGSFDGSAIDQNLVPATTDTYSLGTPDKVWKDLYIGPGSLYLNGTKILEDNSGTITMYADAGQNLSFGATGGGSIDLNAGDESIQIKSDLVLSVGETISTVGGAATRFGGSVNMQTHKIENVGAPTADLDVATKLYVDTLIAAGVVSGDRTFDANVVVEGNLTVSGTTTTVNSETISLADNIIDLNSNLTSGAPTEHAGIRVLRGDESAVQVRWNETEDHWEVYNGSTWTKIALDTDDLAEGSTNLYFTEVRARGCVSADVNSCIDYDESTGKFSLDVAETEAAITPDSAKDADKLDGQHGSYYRINVYDANGTLVN